MNIKGILKKETMFTHTHTHTKKKIILEREKIRTSKRVEKNKITPIS